MNVEGAIRVDIVLSARGTEEVSVSSDRPLQLARVFTGLTPPELLEAIPLLFSVCAMAQANAAARACHQAAGRPIDPAVDLGRDALVLAEILREHGMRIALDWPRHLGAGACWDIARPINGLVQGLKRNLFPTQNPFLAGALIEPDVAGATHHVAAVKDHLQRRIFGEPTDVFLARRTLSSLREWSTGTDTPAARLVNEVLRRDWAGAGRCSVPVLPSDAESAIGERLFGGEADAFVARPEWRAQPAETSALARQCGHSLVRQLDRRYGSGLLTRLAARLLELAALPDRIDELCRRAVDEPPSFASRPTDAPGYGVAAVETARGRLIHAVHLVRGRLRDIHILAPTEWNFHPRGVVAQGLKTLVGAEESDISTQARVLIESIDPCVGYRLSVHHA